MPRLADLIFTREFELPLYCGKLDVARLAKDSLKDCTIIVADNVAEYLDIVKDGPSYYELPPLAPPSDEFWVEYRSSSQHGLIGVRFSLIEITSQMRSDPQVQLDLTGIRWLLLGWGFSYPDRRDGYRDDVVSGPFACYVATLTPEAKISRFWVQHPYTGLPGKIPTRSYELFEEFRLDPEHAYVVYPAFLALSLINCKNVTIEEGQHTETPTAASYWKHKHRRPLCKHYILNIEPMRKMLAAEGRVNQQGMLKALHVCRGHFRTYDETHKLFGKLTGTFWVPSHVRGNPLAGEIRKWYAAEPQQ